MLLSKATYNWGTTCSNTIDSYVVILCTITIKSPLTGWPPSKSGGSHWTTHESSPTLRILGASGGSGTSVKHQSSVMPFLQLTSKAFCSQMAALFYTFEYYKPSEGNTHRVMINRQKK